jgi:CRISPR-associated protein Csm3
MPRQLERVPAGAKFNFEMVLNIFEDDKEVELVSDLFSGMQLLQNDYIGGAGSRGSGQVKFLNTTMKVCQRSSKFYLMEEDEKDVTDQYKQYFPK